MQVLVNGQLISYADEGKGKVLVLLHGWGARLSTFDALAKSLSSQYRVIRLDFPGFGGSPKPADNWGVGEYAELTAAFLKKLDVNKVYTLMGHSFGGRVIIKGAATGVLAADKIVLLNAAGPRSKDAPRRALFKAVAKTGKAVTALPGLRGLRKGLRAKLYKAAGSTDYLNAEAMKTIFLNTVKEDLTPFLKDVSSPALLLWGESDQDVPVKTAELMRDLLPKAKLVVLQEAGHFAYLDQPDRALNQIKEFLA
jgi:pimeloyl-ACP methyl ester carboxylesterase